MKNIRKKCLRAGSMFAALFLLTAVAIPVFGLTGKASAGVLTSRKVTLGSSADGNTVNDANGVAVAAGNGGNGAQTRHTFTFTPTAATIGSMVFMYCNTPFEGTTCAVPTGIDVSTVNAVTSPNNLAATYTVDSAVNTSAASGVGYFAPDQNACGGGTGGRTNCILIRTATATAEAATAKSITFGAGSNWIKNPTANGTYYVRIITFTSNDFNQTGSMSDYGTVAFAITDEINIEAKVQEQLKFSVSSSNVTPAGASCDPLTGNALIPLGNSGVLDSSTAYDAHSYFRVSTNAAYGTAIQYSGDTLRTTSGGFSVTAPTGPATSAVGAEQFGMTINVAGSTMTHLTNRTAAYNTGTGNGPITAGGSAQFAYSTGSLSAPVTLVTTNAGTPTIVACDTVDMRYVANIAPTTEPGIYRTSIAYIATPTY